MISPNTIVEVTTQKKSFYYFFLLHSINKCNKQLVVNKRGVDMLAGDDVIKGKSG